MTITNTLRGLFLVVMVLGVLGGEPPKPTLVAFAVDSRPLNGRPSPTPVRVIKVPYWRPVWAKVTAYSPFDALDAGYRLLKGRDRWKTSQGQDVRFNHYGVAADPRAVPYGTPVIIPGYMDGHPGKSWEVDDTGGRMRQAWSGKGLIALDVRYWTSYSVKNWGVKWQWVYLWVQPDSALEHQLQAYDLRVHGQPVAGR